MQQLTQYEIDITLQEIKNSDGYLEYHKCGYPIYWAYSITSDNGKFEEEYFEPVDIVKGNTNLWNIIESYTCCGEKLDPRISGNYSDFDII